jgi:predicted CXXCH cytochrome family protein
MLRILRRVKFPPRALIVALLLVVLPLVALLLLPAAMSASAVEHSIEHPGILPKDANCSSCHINKTQGKSVHAAMAMPCTVCHLATTEGDMTTLILAAPKEKICFACHEKSAQLRRHKPTVKVGCVDCHDSHSSTHRSLLREHAVPN